MPTETCTVIFQGAYDGTRKREGVFKERQFGWYRRSVQLLSHVWDGGCFFISMLRNKAVGSGPSIAAQNQIKAKKPNGGNNHEKDKYHP